MEIILKLKILVHVLIFHQDNKLVGNQWSPPGFLFTQKDIGN